MKLMDVHQALTLTCLSIGFANTISFGARYGSIDLIVNFLMLNLGAKGRLYILD